MKNMKIIQFTIILLTVIIQSSAQTIQEVKIGKQIWMTDNLSVDTFRNGDPILHAKTNKQWVNASRNRQPAYCFYNNDKSNDLTFGKLYNWYAINDQRGLAPVGWHVPNDIEWMELTNYLGGEPDAGTKLKKNTGWKDNGSGSNSTRFSALPGGLRHSSGIFYDIGKFGYWWTSTSSDQNNAMMRYIYYKVSNVVRLNFEKSLGYSVRCLKNY